MGWRRYLPLRVAAWMFFASGLLSAQVFDLSGGASTLYGAQGATLSIHGSRSETTFGAGLLNGHFAAGGATVRVVHSGTIVAGQQQFSVDQPTDIFESSHYLFGTGLGLHAAATENRGLNTFIGLSSTEGGTPLFQSADLGKLAALARWTQPITGTCKSVSTLLSAANAKSLAESIQCSPSSNLRLAATVGLGRRGSYQALSLTLKQTRLQLRVSYIRIAGKFDRGSDTLQLTPEPVRENISGEYRLTHSVSLSGLHQNYLFRTGTPSGSSAVFGMTPSSLVLHNSVDEASIHYRRAATGLNLTVLHSRAQKPPFARAASRSDSDIALSAGFNHNFGRVQWTESLLRFVEKNGSRNTLVLNGLSFALNPHLRLTESANVAGSGTTFSHGGAFVTRFSSFEVDYQTLYLANRPANPFQQAMVFDSQLRIPRDVAVRAASSIGPTGNTLYTFSLDRQFTRNASSPEPLSPGGLGANILRGRVTSPAGEPVEGAALMVGSVRLYTDSQGNFFYRERSPRVHSFTVLLNEFVGVGRFVTVSAPHQVQTAANSGAEPVTVIVDHLSEPKPNHQPSGTYAHAATPTTLQAARPGTRSQP